MKRGMKHIAIIAAALSAASSFAPNYARAQKAIVPVPPPEHVVVPAWWWAGFACPASVVLSAVAADFLSNRQLTAPEAWTCGLLYWIPMPVAPKPAGHRH
jgi:hypothetical protein